MKARSLRSRLTISLVGVLAGSLLVMSLVVHVVIAHALEGQFDGRLLDDALAVAGMCEDDAGSVEFEYESLPDFERTERPAYFEAWLDDGAVLARSPSLARGDLPRLSIVGAAPVFADVRLPDGRAGRVVRLRRALRVEPAAPPQTSALASDRYVTVAVVRGTEDLAEALRELRRWLLLLAVLTTVGASTVAVVAVARGLRSTDALSSEIARLDVGRLERVSAADLPAELVPLVEKLNGLISRVEASVQREKRFTADVSHELRTPLAALRATLDVVTSRERTVPELQRALADVNVVVRQMQSLCENLLALARLDAGSLAIRSTDVELRELVEECWSPVSGLAAKRNLAFANELAPGFVTRTDPDQLRVVVTNLLSNAVAYTDAGGEITVRTPEQMPGAVLEIHDSGPSIPEPLLPHIFERFVRGDSARSDGIHCGIGLALSRGIAETLRLDLTAQNTRDGGVSFALHLRRDQASGVGEDLPPG